MPQNNQTLLEKTVADQWQTLPSGLTVLVRPMPGYSSTHVIYATKFGSIDRDFCLNGQTVHLPAGVAHFLEHKMFEDEDGDAFAKYAKTGANANAFTSFDRTCYLFTATQQLDESLDVLLGMVGRGFDTVIRPEFQTSDAIRECVDCLKCAEACPTGALRISDINIVNADGTAKADEVTNTYTAYGLSVVKHLSGNFANAGDEFTFTIALDDPDETPHVSSVTVKTGGESADFSTITGDTVAFNADGTAEVKAGITGGEKIELTGLPANTGYTITESGDTASSYTTTWDGITKTGSDDKTSDAQTMAAADKTITVTNSRTAPTPTGLLLDVVPYGTMLLAAGTGSVLLLRKRHNSDE